MNWSNLIGKKVAALRGVTLQKSEFDKTLHTPLTHILFDDGETFIELREQSAYDYHDCNYAARVLDLRRDAKEWGRMFNKQSGFNEPDNATYPFD